jgi:hypothetical protein
LLTGGAFSSPQIPQGSALLEKSDADSWLQYYLQFASEDSILFLDQHEKAKMLDVSLLLVVGSIVVDPSEGGSWRVEGVVVL